MHKIINRKRDNFDVLQLERTLL